MNIKRIMVAVLAATGLMSGGAMARTADAQQSQRQLIAAKASSAREVRADLFGGFAGGLKHAYERNTGHPPDVWGRSVWCAKMVRKNRLRKMGLGGQKR